MSEGNPARSRGDKARALAIWLALLATIAIVVWETPWPLPCQREQTNSAQHQQQAVNAGSVVLAGGHSRSNYAYYKCDETDADWWIVRIAGLAATIATLQLVMFYFQWRVMRESLGDTKKAADAALDNAKSALLQARATVASERAIVIFRGGAPFVFDLETDAPVQPGAIPEWLYVKLPLANIGRTPAIMLGAEVNWLVWDGDPPPTPVYFRQLLGSNQAIIQNVPLDVDLRNHAQQLDPSQRVRIDSRQAILWAYGYVRFRNFIDEVWDQRFILRWDRPLGIAPARGFVAEGPEPYNQLILVSAPNAKQPPFQSHVFDTAKVQ